MMNFVAIDLETVNSDMASICQIGIVRCRDGVVAEEWSTYVDPEDGLDRVNVSIYGIEETAVEGYRVRKHVAFIF
jgi:DNA polymerase-3 subunit epsilon